jgi:hypothetical protein
MRVALQALSVTTNETIATGAYLLVCTALWLLGLLPIENAVYLTFGYLVAILFLAWYRFDGGRHPVFLFLGLLLIFQGGRLLGAIFGLINDPFRIEVQTWSPFDVSSSTKGITLLILALSATLAYLPCSLFYRKVRLSHSYPDHLLPTLYVLFGLTGPFLVLKNYLYVKYMQTHGGYYAIYTDYDGVVGSAGTAVRLLALLGTQAFMLIYVIERRTKRLMTVTCLFMLVSIGDLLVGYRGKVFTLILTLWFIRNIKRGKGFPLLVLVLGGVALTSIGFLALAFREQHDVNYINPLQFAVQQGISLNVTECAVEFRHVFNTHGASYLLHGLESVFIPVEKAKSGQLFSQDLSVFLNPIAYSMGTGTGSAYMAEAYIAGGLFAVCTASFVLGIAFAWIQRLGGRFSGGIAMVCFGQFLIYTPRSGLFEPVSLALKTALPLGLILFTANMIGRSDRSISGRSKLDLAGNVH